jgi:glycosyltransferase involved in cell wall biosynthesis
MAFFLATFFGTITCFLIWFQIGYVVWYLKFLSRPRVAVDFPTTSPLVVQSPLTPVSGLPRVAVIMCLRGADPSLKESLLALQSQVYPNWELHLVVDSDSDPALELVAVTLGPDHPAGIHTISQRTDTASLKCQAINTAIRQLPDEIEYLAFLDADTICDSLWLLDLISPMIAGETSSPPAATTGNRWFLVTDNQLASHLRQIWNAAAIVQMAIYNIAWGGSFAIAKSALRKTELSNRWSEAFCEDTMLTRVLSDHQMQLYRVPQLVCSNSESVGLGSVYHWIVRQLLTVRLYHPRWFLVQGHSVVLLTVSLLAPLAAVLCCWNEDWQAAGWIAFAWTCFQGVNYRLLQEIERRNLEILQHRQTDNQRLLFANSKPLGELALKSGTEAVALAEANNKPAPTPANFPNPADPPRGWTFLLATLLAQLIHPLACLQASWATQISWRGINYRIERGNKIRLLEYHPYRQIQPSTGQKSCRSSGRSID